MHLLRLRPVLDEFEHVVAENNAARRHRQILPDLEGALVDHRRHARIVDEVGGHVAQTLDDAAAAGLDDALDGRRIGQRITGRQRVGDELPHEVGPLFRARIEARLVDEIVERFRPGEVAAQEHPVERVAGPGGIGEALVVARRLDRRLPGEHQGDLTHQRGLFLEQQHRVRGGFFRELPGRRQHVFAADSDEGIRSEHGP